MTKYAQTAPAAAKLVTSHQLSAEAAWDKAAEQVFPTQLASRAKSCPRQSFIALANGHMIKGTLAPTSAGVSKNVPYELEAVQALRQ